MKRGFNWATGVFLIFHQLSSIIGVPLYLWYFGISSAMFWLMIAGVFLTGMAITMGYHRLYAHRTFQAKRIVEIPMLFFGTLAGQSSVLRWSFDHRLHHRYTDTEEDPYSVKDGFWHAHMGWLFEKPLPIDEKVIPDLVKRPLLVFQHKHYIWLFLATNAFVTVAVGWLLGDLIGAFVFVWWARLFISHHTTWLINSAAHMWGARTFSSEQSAVNNWLLAFLTFGEGYHNYHHAFPTDYRNGVRWWQFDPAKWTVWLLSLAGLAGGLKRVQWATTLQKRIQEDKVRFLDSTRNMPYHDALVRCMNEMASGLEAKLDRVRVLYHEAQKRQEKKLARRKLRRLRKDIRHEWRKFSQVVKLARL